MTYTIEVVGCSDCPFDSDEHAECEHPGYLWRAHFERSTMQARAEHAGEAWAPDWCPLRRGDVLVTLRMKEMP
jgi:hypothetical protein